MPMNEVRSIRFICRGSLVKYAERMTVPPVIGGLHEKYIGPAGDLLDIDRSCWITEEPMPYLPSIHGENADVRDRALVHHHPHKITGRVREQAQAVGRPIAHACT